MHWSIEGKKGSGGGRFRLGATAVRLCIIVASATLAGKGRTQGQFEEAEALSVDPLKFTYILDAGANTLVKLSDKREVLVSAGGYGWSDQAFDHPADVIAPNGLDVYVADYGNHRIQRFDRNLNFVSSFSTRNEETATVQFGYPSGVAQDRFGSLFITDGENKRIVKVNATGGIESVFGDIAAGEGRLESPSRVRVSTDDRVYVRDLNRIVIFDIFGNYLGTLGHNLFRRLRSFNVEGKTVFVLDSCRVEAFREGGEGDHLRVVLTQGTGRDLCDAIDIDVKGDRLYVLTEHRVWTEKLLLEQVR